MARETANVGIAYLHVFDFHLRPSQHTKMAAVIRSRSRVFGAHLRSKDPVDISLEIGGKPLPHTIFRPGENLLIPEIDGFRKILPANTAIEITVQNKSKGTRKWNRGKLVIHMAIKL